MTHPAEAATFEEIEQQIAADGAAGGKGSEALKTKLDGEAIPEAYRGKTVEDIIKLADAAQKGLNISEQARKDAETAAAAARAVAAAPPAPAPSPPAPEPEFGEKEFREEYAKDAAGAFVKLQNATEKRIQKNFEQRFTPLVVSATSVAEEQARAQFPEEFTLFKDEIEDFIKTQLGGDRSRISTVKAWGEMLSYIRGQPANVEKLFEHRRKKSDDDARKAAETRAEQATGFTATPNARRAPPEPAGGTQLDPVEKQIAAEFVRSGILKDESEYPKWKGASK